MIFEEQIFIKAKDLIRKGFVVSFYGVGPDKDNLIIRLRRDDFQTCMAIGPHDVVGLSPDQVERVIIRVLENMEAQFDGR